MLGAHFLRVKLLCITLAPFSTPKSFDYFQRIFLNPMKIRLTTALVLSLLALSCTKSALNSGQEAELKPRANPVQVGEVAPNFTLEDQNGQKVKLSDLHNAPTVLAFYRGNW
jgi:cytochrome oxidase Cu insertion factor (SCO1/SenC/PrrC family)